MEEKDLGDLWCQSCNQEEKGGLLLSQFPFPCSSVQLTHLKGKTESGQKKDDGGLDVRMVEHPCRSQGQEEEGGLQP